MRARNHKEKGQTGRRKNTAKQDMLKRLNRSIGLAIGLLHQHHPGYQGSRGTRCTNGHGDALFICGTQRAGGVIDGCVVIVEGIEYSRVSRDGKGVIIIRRCKIVLRVSVLASLRNWWEDELNRLLLELSSIRCE